MEAAAEAVGEKHGITGRAALKRADLINPTRVAQEHRTVSEIIAIVKRSGGIKNFFQKLFE